MNAAMKVLLHPLIWAMVLLPGSIRYAEAQPGLPLSTSGGRSVERMTPVDPRKATADVEQTVSFKARLTHAEPKTRGEVWFVFVAERRPHPGQPAQRIVGKVPISSTEEAYGEERTCTVNGKGQREMVFTAGLDEENFAGFSASAGEAREFHFLLNKYLCRILAAPFRCNGAAVDWPEDALDMRSWRIVSSGVMLRSAARSTLEMTPVAVTSRDVPFDYAQCAKVAPSSGLCCVQGKTTEWHCGGTPAGQGWHQVSGECFHRETGGSCRDGAVPLQESTIVLQ